MKYLKLFESQSIKGICKLYNIENYHINADGAIDVHGNVNLAGKRLHKIPLKFGEVSGHFNCELNSLTKIIGSPRRVGRNFTCNHNNLTSLEGCPEYIGTFFCNNNPNLWSFDHFPRHAKWVNLSGTPIQWVFNLFSDVYLADGGEYFKTSWGLMDFFEHCDPVYPDKIIKKRRMNNFLASIEKELRPDDIEILKNDGWKIED